MDLAIRRLQMEDENLQAPAFCRRSAKKMMEIARDADITLPVTQKEFIVWPEPTIGEYVHYALRVTTIGVTIIYNPVQAPGFPQYIGAIDSAPGLLPEMIVTEQVV